MINVAITNINKVVLEGQSVNVNVDITNNYNQNKQDVEINLKDFNGNVVDNIILYPSIDEQGQPLTQALEPGATESINLNWSMKAADSGKDFITVSSDDESVKELIIGVFSFSVSSTYLETTGSNYIAQININTNTRKLADAIKPPLEQVLNDFKNEVIAKLEQDL